MERLLLRMCSWSDCLVVPEPEAHVLLVTMMCGQSAVAIGRQTRTVVVLAFLPTNCGIEKRKRGVVAVVVVVAQHCGTVSAHLHSVWF